MRSVSRLLACLLALLTIAGPAGTATSPQKVALISYEDARNILSALAENAPPVLRNQGVDVAAAWPSWVAQQDRAIRARLQRGEEDSLANFLLFGISYTRQPRVTAEDLARLAQKQEGAVEDSAVRGAMLASNLIRARLEDLVRALAAPGGNERLSYLRTLLEGNQMGVRTPADQARLKAYFLSNALRVLKERDSYAKALEAARQLGDTSREFAERSTLYRDRGLSLDTSWLPNVALEESLKAMTTRGLLAPGSVRRAAVIGPGLDFADKQAGYDFYPQQTIQPFGLIDTLLRLGLSKAGQLELTTFDISPRVNAHLTRSVRRARQGAGYVVQLPRDLQVSWKPEVLSYWERFGDRIGAPVTPIAVPLAAGKLKLRAVRISPTVVSRVSPVDLNIVLQHLDLPASDRFDLIVATNIFVYYDVFEQSVALANVERMLRPGGFLLSNNALLELPGSHMHSVDYLTAVYSDRSGDGDHLVWYQRSIE